MARTLQINVQIDRLPVIAGVPKPYFGVRLSAWIVPAPPERASPADWTLLVPWRWTGPDHTQQGSWDPRSPSSWSAWWVDPTKQPPTATVAVVTPVINQDGVTPPSSFSTIWQPALNLAMVELSRDPHRLESPGLSPAPPNRPTPVADRTLFGLVESLTAFPAPWPEAHKVWTCLRVDTDPPSTNCELVVVPVFGVDNPPGSYAVRGVPTMSGSVADHQWRVAYAPIAAPSGVNAYAMVDRLIEAPDVGSRIILKEKFLVGGAKDWASATSQDWMAQLPAQIAEVLDPARGFAQGLEQTLAQYADNLAVAKAAPAAQRTPVQSALLNIPLPTTPGQRWALRLLLGAAHWRMLAPAATGTRGGTPLPVALARANPGAESQSLLAGLTARDAARATPNDPVPGFFTSEKLQVWTDDRLLGLLNLPRDPPGAFSPPDWGESVDAPDGLRRFLVNHWTSPPSAPVAFVSLSAASTTLMRFTATSWDHGIVADPDGSFGLFDLSVIDTVGSASISFKLTTAQAGVVIVANLMFDGVPRPIATVSSAVIAAAGDHTLTLTVAPPPAPALAPPPAAAAAASPPPPPPPPQPSFGISIDSGPAAVGNFVEPALSSRRGYVTLQLKAAGPKVTLTAEPASSGTAVQLLANTSDPALRANLALLYAAPYVPIVLSGIGPDGNQVSPPARPDGSPATVTDKIAFALAAWAKDRLLAECAAAITSAEALSGLTPSPISPITMNDIRAVEPLFQLARDTAIANAQAQAARLFAPLAPDAASFALSVKALPIVFPIDQPQPLETTQDLWSMFAGVGVLAGLSSTQIGWPDNSIWYSLNIASMFLPTVDPSTNIRASLKDSPIVPGPAGAFDPVPQQIGEVGGVRAASVTYENRSLVGEMPHDPVHATSLAVKAVPRRIEAYGFPGKALDASNPKLPALCFGKRYFFLPYLIGHGGALPVCLRDPSKREVATKFLPKNQVPGSGGQTVPDPSGRITFLAKDLNDYLAGLNDPVSKQPITSDDIVRHFDYRRTTPIGAPRLSGKELPGVPDGVEALASEIPIRPTPITLAAGETAYFYRNKERTEGTLDFTSPDPTQRAIQIDFGGLPPGDNASSRPDLQVLIEGRGGGQPLLNETISAAYWPPDSSLGLRMIVGHYGIEVFPEVARRPPDAFVERPAQFGAGQTIKPGPVNLAGWQAFSISVSNKSSADATLLPPVLSMGTGQRTDHQLNDPREIPLPEAAHKKRVITVLDGIPPIAAMLGGVALKIRRPAVEFSTYERWINWDLTDKDVKDALDAAHQLVALNNPTRADDLTIDDPAVERVAVELVELFPNPKFHARALLAADWSAAKTVLIRGFQTSRADDPSLPIRVGKPNEPAGLSNPGGTGMAIVLAPGAVYEVRLYGAVPEDKQNFVTSLPALPTSDARFGKGAWQGLLRFTDAGKKYRLGAPLVLTFEVATAAMPELYKIGTDPDSPLAIDRSIAATGTGDRAQVGLRHQFVLDSYPNIRYVSRVSLLNQRWGWRGRPLGTLPAPEEFRGSGGADPGDQAHRLGAGHLKDFEEIAFIDRRTDDIGVIEETKLHLAHVLPPADAGGILVPEAGDNRPPIFVKDLLYRGGANWWRFALAATSRYATMKPGRDLVSYSHIDPTDKFNAHWHTLIVRDRDTGRKPKRPGLTLVLPLTETVMSDTAVPPLLAVFSEPMFANFHIGDGAEGVLDYVRHPLPEASITWTGQADQARDLLALIAEKYAELGSGQSTADGKTALRTAVATYNTLLRSRQAASAAAALITAQNKVAAAAAAVQAISQEPQTPERDARLAAAQAALTQANRESQDASVALADANAAVLSADQILGSVQQGGTDNLPDLQPESQRFWPQFGPDPILTSTPHSGRPVPLRIDGPLGYTFDLETEAPRFGRSGFLVTPIPGQAGTGQDLNIAAFANARIRPWTFARMRFRRLEAIELSLSKPVPVGSNGVATDLLLSSDEISMPATGGVSAPIPSEFHEGLVIDFSELDATAGATVSVVQGALPGADWSNRYVQVAARVSTNAFSVFLNTDLGPAGTFDVSLRPTSVVSLRLVLSQREKPAQSDQAYEPVLDVSVRLLIDDGDGDGLVRSQAGAWVTIACLPLLAGGKAFKPSDPVYVHVVPDPAAAAIPQAVAVRLTPFTAPLWCQFTQDVSRFDVTTTALKTFPDWPVTSLTATLDPKSALTLLLMSETDTPQPLQSVKWLATDKNSQVGCVVAAIVTEIITDAFDRVRERPIAVYRVDDGPLGTDGKYGPAAMKPMWGQKAVAKSAQARVRLMSLMYLQLDPSQPAPASLADFFADPFDDTIGMEASDSVGRILGVSKPIEVSSIK